MQKDQIDQNLNFKKRARRRLVGAIALVLLMVVILPWMLEDREKKFQEEDVEIIMPSQSNKLEASIELDDLTDDHVEKLILNDVENEPSESEPVDFSKIATPTEQVDSEKTAPSIEAKKESVAPMAQNKTAEKADKFYVQIGVFADPSNIKKLQLKLDELGYKSLTEKITTDTGVKTRLRTESFVGRNEAAIALQNIKDAGLAGMVVSQK